MCIVAFLNEKIDRNKIENQYLDEWFSQYIGNNTLIINLKSNFDSHLFDYLSHFLTIILKKPEFKSQIQKPTNYFDP